MSVRDTLVRNTFWYGVITVAGLVSGLLMSIVLARGLGPEHMGDYSFVLWVGRTVHAVTVLGFALATIRYTAAALGQSDGALASAFLRFFLRRQLFMTTLVVVTLLPLVVFFDPWGLRWPLAVILVGLFPSTLEGIFVSSIYGAQRFEISSRVSAIKMTLQLATAALAVYLGAGVLGVMIGGVFGGSVAYVLNRRNSRKLYPEAPSAIPVDRRREVFSYLVPLSVVVVLETLVWDRSEVFFLRMYATRQDIAFYSLAFGLATKLMVLAEIMAGALLPALSSLYGSGDHTEFSRVYRTALRYVSLIGAPLAVVGWALAPGIIDILYGDRYAPVGALLGPLLVVAVVGVMRQVAWASLFATGDRRSALNATWVSAVVNVGAAALLIPRYGTMGAVEANAAGQMLASVWAFIAVARRHGCRFPAWDVAKIAAAATAALGVTLALRHGGGSLLTMAVAGAAGLCVFAAVAIVSGVVGIREWNLVSRYTRALVARLPRPSGALVVLVAGGAVTALYAQVLRELSHTWRNDPHYSYGFLVPAFSAWAVWDMRPRLAPRSRRWSPAGLVLVAGGLVMLAGARAVDSLTLAAVSLPVVLAGAAVFALGPAPARALTFPLVFLAFMAPLPAAAIDAISLRLQLLAAWSTDHLLTLLAVPHLRRGLLVHLRGLTLEITEACSGLRFLLAMIVIGAAFAGLLSLRRRARVGVMVTAVAVGLVANLVRVGATAVLADRYGVAAASGFFHVAMGKVIYAIMLVPFIAIVVWLRGTVAPDAAPETEKGAARPARVARKLRQLRVSIGHNGILETVYWAAYGYLRPNSFFALARDVTVEGPAPVVPPGVTFEMWPRDRVRAWRGHRAGLPVEFFRDEIDGLEECAVATVNGDLAGLIWVYHPEHDSRLFRLGPGEAELNHGAIRPEYRERGLFRGLMTYAAQRLGEEGVRTIYAGVHSTNHRSHRAFLGAGFREIAYITHFLFYRPRISVRVTPAADLEPAAR